MSTTPFAVMYDPIRVAIDDLVINGVSVRTDDDIDRAIIAAISLPDQNGKPLSIGIIQDSEGKYHFDGEIWNPLHQAGDYSLFARIWLRAAILLADGYTLFGFTESRGAPGYRRGYNTKLDELRQILYSIENNNGCIAYDTFVQAAMWGGIRLSIDVGRGL